MNSELYSSGAYTPSGLNDAQPASEAPFKLTHPNPVPGSGLGAFSLGNSEGSLQQQQQQQHRQQQHHHSQRQDQEAVQNSASQLWSVTPVVDFPATAQEGRAVIGTEGGAALAPMTNSLQQHTDAGPVGAFATAA